MSDVFFWIISPVKCIKLRRDVVSRERFLGHAVIIWPLIAPMIFLFLDSAVVAIISLIASFQVAEVRESQTTDNSKGDSSWLETYSDQGIPIEIKW